VTERLQALMRSAIAEATGTERLVAMLSSFLPVNEQREDTIKVWVAFLGYAVGRESLMVEHQKSAAQLRELIIQELEELQTDGLVRADIDPVDKP